MIGTGWNSWTGHGVALSSEVDGEKEMAMPSTAGTQTAVETILHTLLHVARLGEADRRSWWGTRSFGAAGRVVLKQRLPRTWRMAAAELDIAAARNRHDEVIERRNAVHLFSDNWPVRRWTSAWVAEQKTADPPDSFLEELETITDDEITQRLRGADLKTPIAGTAVRLGTVDKTAFDSADALAPSVALLAAAYVEMDGFTVPYLEVSG
jgi:hypothetical protein